MATQQETAQEQQRYTTRALLFILAVTVFRLIYSSGLDALPDEADYFVWSLKPDLSYFCHPPMLMYFLALVDRFVYDRVLVLRLVTTMLSAFSLVLVFHLAHELFQSSKQAFYAIVLANVTLLFTAGAVITTPDTPMIFFLSGACYFFYLAIEKDETKFWLIAGGFVGFALLSKLVAVLIYLSFFIFLLLPENRKWLAKAQPYLAFLLSMLIFSPVIWWNSQHDWTTFAFQLQHGFGGNTRFPRWDKFFEFLGGQLGLVGPVLFLIFLAALVTIAASWKKRSLQEKYLWCLSSVPFLFFLFSSLQKKVEANWACFAYVPGILLAMTFYERAMKRKSWGRGLWKANWILKAFVLVLLLIHVYIPILPIPLEKDRTNDFYGWEELGQEAARLASEHPDLAPAANRYQIASEIIFYSDLPLVCLNIDSRPNQFDLWQKGRQLAGKDYLFFDDRSKPKESIVNAFERFEYLTTIPMKRGDKIFDEIQVYKAYNYRPQAGS